ncbi:alpha/beta hydrolase [Brevundimonas sp.]|uniref:alpha/beta hydrolase n=1 Tax=Brevundimonas sp. TaxID=1871086 RepID=UPI003BAB11BD
MTTPTGTRHLVDPQLLDLLDNWPTIALTPDNLQAIRELSRLPMPAADEAGAAVQTERRTVAGPAGAPDVDVVIYRPAGGASDPLPCIFHIHGGGYVLGSAAANEGLHRPLVARLGCVLITVEYRLAPETVAPGAVEDCYAALDWTFANAVDLGIDATRIGVMGESAGGGLAAALALLTRDRGEHRLAFQHLIYPMIDDRTCTHADPHPHTGEFIWTPHNNHFGWKSLLGVEPGSDRVSPYAAAARAEDLSGLPPTFISTGSLDLFLEEDLEYARRLLRAAVPVELHVYPGGIHGFELAPDVAVSAQAVRDQTAALARFMDLTA